MDRHYTLVIGTKNWSSWSLRPWLALRAAGVAFDEIVIALRRSNTAEEIRKIAGSETVPSLHVHDREGTFTVFDSLAICESLAEWHPEAKLWPEKPALRAPARSISAAMHSGFAALRATLPMEIARSFPTPEMSNQVRADIARVTQFWREALDLAEPGGFLFGPFTIADCMYAPVVSRFRTYGVSLDRALEAYCDRIFDLPAMCEWLAAARMEVAAGLP